MRTEAARQHDQATARTETAEAAAAAHWCVDAPAARKHAAAARAALDAGHDNDARSHAARAAMAATGIAHAAQALAAVDAR